MASAAEEISAPAPARSTGADSRTAALKHGEFKQPGHKFKSSLSVSCTQTQKFSMDNKHFVLVYILEGFNMKSSHSFWQNANDTKTKYGSSLPLSYLPCGAWLTPSSPICLTQQLILKTKGVWSRSPAPENVSAFLERGKKRLFQSVNQTWDHSWDYTISLLG